MYISKATTVKLYRNFGYNYYQPDAGMGSFRPYVKILLENLEINQDIIEVGVGDNSTPMWTKKVNELDHINSFHFENDLDSKKIQEIKIIDKLYLEKIEFLNE